MGYLKGKSSLMIFQKFGNIKFAYRNREFWCMVFAGSGITYSELKEMDLREYREAVEARLLWQGEWNPNRKK